MDLEKWPGSSVKLWNVGTYRERLDWVESHVCVLCCVFSFFFFFFIGSNRTFWPSQPWTVHGCTVHESHKFHFLATFSLKMDPTALFTHLKIFHYSVFSFSKNKLNSNEPIMSCLVICKSYSRIRPLDDAPSPSSPSSSSKKLSCIAEITMWVRLQIRAVLSVCAKIFSILT